MKKHCLRPWVWLLIGYQLTAIIFKLCGVSSLSWRATTIPIEVTLWAFVLLSCVLIVLALVECARDDKGGRHD